MVRRPVPARLGAEFTKLWTASAVSTVGDGITTVAGPLLVASLTTDPALVAGAAFAHQVPWLLLSLVSGAYVDRVDRLRLIVTIDVLRGVVLAVLVVAVATGRASIPLVYGVFFLLGAGATLAGPASSALLPALVAPEKLANANARLMATFTIGNQFLAKPVGAGLFVLAAAVPFGVNAVTFVIAAAVVATIGRVPAPTPPEGTRLWADIAVGLRWLWRQRLLRTLAVSMGASNVVFCAAFAVFVLYARQRLGLSEVGYGLLLTTFAVGGLTGTALAARLQALVGSTALLRAGLIIEATTHLGLALTTSPPVAAIVLIVFGVHTMVWGVIAVTLRQRITPSHLLGRVTSAYALLDLGGAALGSLLGGLFAHSWGITAPFWIASVVMTVIVAAAWRPLGVARRCVP